MATFTNVSYLTGDMFTSTASAKGQGINIYGKMGAGVAVLFRKRYPLMYSAYVAACTQGTIKPGDLFPYMEDGHWIFNIASQDKPGPHARLDWLESGLEKAFFFCEDNDLESFAIPRIGAGIGGLQWKDVKDTLEEVAARHPNVHLEVWTLPENR